MSTKTNIWTNIARLINDSNLTDRTPLAYLQIISLQWILTAERHGSKGNIFCGDLNATWSAREKGGQHLLGPWAKLNNFINGPQQIAEFFGFRTITRQKNDSSGTWIDHIIYKTEQEVLNIKAANTNNNPELEDLTDHRPLWEVFRTQYSLNRAPFCKAPPRTHFDLNMRYPLMVDDF